VQNAEYPDSIIVAKIEDGKREAISQRPPEFTAYDRIGFGIAGDTMDGSANAQAKIILQARPYLPVPTNGSSQVGLGWNLDNNAKGHRLPSQASTSSQGDPGGSSPRS